MSATLLIDTREAAQLSGIKPAALEKQYNGVRHLYHGKTLFDQSDFKKWLAEFNHRNSNDYIIENMTLTNGKVNA